MPLLCLHRDEPPEQEPRHFRVRLETIDLRACCTRPVIRFTAPARRPPGLQDAGPAPRRPPRERAWTPRVRDEGRFQVHGSCDGVLLVSYKAGLFYLCNPARRRWTEVLALRVDDIVGLYDAHRPSGDFRVLLLHRPSSRRGTVNVDYDCQILITVSPSPVTLRKISGRGPHSDDQLLAAIMTRIRPASESPPALVAGNLHWLRYQCTECLLQCDAKGRVRIRHQPEHHRIAAVPHMFRESLVAHAWLRQRSRDHNRVRAHSVSSLLPRVDCNCNHHKAPTSRSSIMAICSISNSVLIL